MAIRRTFIRSFLLLIGAALSLTALVACSSDDDSAASDADAITVTDQWVKTAPSGMTAAFATLTNSTDRDVRIVAAHTADAKTTEMHEVVPNGSGGTTMRQIDGGFLIPAQRTVTLTPGGEHFMLMDLPKPIVTGQKVAFTIRFPDGSTKSFDALARDFDGNQENYAPGDTGEHK